MRAIAIVAALAVTVAGIAAAEDAAGFTPPFPPQTQMPSPSNPFFFLHLAKCAGTSLRYLLHNRTLGVITDSSVCIPTYTHHHHVRAASSPCACSVSPRTLLVVESSSRRDCTACW
jgi:hypothetical protein